MRRLRDHFAKDGEEEEENGKNDDDDGQLRPVRLKVDSAVEVTIHFQAEALGDVQGSKTTLFHLEACDEIEEEIAAG